MLLGSTWNLHQNKRRVLPGSICENIGKGHERNMGPVREGATVSENSELLIVFALVAILMLFFAKVTI
jgi:hypothetical protein